MKPVITEMDVTVTDDGWWESVLSDEDQAIHSIEELPTGTDSFHAGNNDWEKVISTYENDEIVQLNVIDHNRGGLLVEGEGLHGFVPWSHLLDISPSIGEKPDENGVSMLMGRKLNLKIIECNPESGRIILSERAATAAAGKRLEIFRSIKSGQRLEGLVTNLTKFGVFVDLGGVEGLIHISELSWGRVVDPNDICELGQRLQVLVLDVHPEKSRIALSLKRLEENPWEIISEKYFVNQIVTARITGLVPYGAFARLEDGVEGLIHSSEFPLNNGNVSDLPLKIGQDVCVKILLINTRQHKLSLSLKI